MKRQRNGFLRRLGISICLSVIIWTIHRLKDKQPLPYLIELMQTARDNGSWKNAKKIHALIKQQGLYDPSMPK